ncbi:hypothetical protein Bhyg_01995 [Pseudolycoriella hygida]|uniref:Uncharacterized protein n=1 Tax=Pseudolycoriella hygida TaxID=35572 RepID=A0A9Q0NAG1_9DIPT|nr:hypothetical protein Bhyg_01995 [Pseudolycoriella hygida]
MLKITSIFSVLLAVQAIKAMVCPQADTIAPCTCLDEFPYERIYCEDLMVTQYEIDRAINHLIAVNNMTVHDEMTWIYLDKFRVKNSVQLTSLDLSDLSLMSIRSIQVYSNPYLENIFVNSSTTNVTELVLYDNNLMSESLMDLVPKVKNTLNSVDLSGINIEYLPAAIFEEFLNENAENRIYGSSNPFICDYRMIWLRKGRDTYERQVANINCENDLYNNIFNTTFTPTNII